MKKRINIILYVLISVLCSGMLAAGIPAAASDTVSYTLTYDANGGSGGPKTQKGTNVKISSDIPLNFPMYFMGWSASDSASEAEYEAGEIITLTGDTTVYAVWKEPDEFSTNTVEEKVVFAYGNRYTYIKFVPEETGNYILESTLTSGDTYGILYNEDGKTLNTNDDSGAGNNFLINYRLNAGETYFFGVRFYRVSGSGNISLKLTRQYDITYDVKGGDEAPENQKKSFGDTITLDTMQPQKTGHTFLGWAVSENSNEVKFNPGDTYSEDANLKLYAVWMPHSFKVKYNANGGKSAPDEQTKYYDIDLHLSTAAPERDGYVFHGWSSDSQAVEPEYQPGGIYSLNDNIELYAVWIEKLAAPEILVENVTGGKKLSITAAEGAVVYYTMDGAEPDENSLVYSEPVNISSTVTIIAVATKEGYARSENAIREIVVEKAVTPVFSIESDVIEEGKTLEIYAPDCIIYYTTDGSDPLDKGIVYTEPFIITEDINIKAVAVREGYANSDVAEKNVIADKLPALALKVAEKNDNEVKIVALVSHNPGISSAFLRLNYPSEALDFASIEKGGILTAGTLNTHETENALNVLWVNTDNVTDNGVMFTITFNKNPEYKEDITVSMLYSEGDVINDAYENVDFKLNDASLVISDSDVILPTEPGISISEHGLKLDENAVSGNVSLNIQSEQDNLYADVLIAVYEDNTLLGITTEKVLLKYGQNMFSRDIYAEASENTDSAVVKIFVWDSMTGMKPAYPCEKVYLSK